MGRYPDDVDDAIDVDIEIDVSIAAAAAEEAPAKEEAECPEGTAAGNVGTPKVPAPGLEGRCWCSCAAQYASGAIGGKLIRPAPPAAAGEG